MTAPRVLVCGYSEVGTACLEALLDLGANVVGLFTHRDDPKENRWFRTPAPVAEAAGIPLSTESLASPEGIALARSLRPDLLLSFYYRDLLGADLLTLPPLGAYNLHGSLLPRYRGRVPIHWAVIRGETRTGATLHVMTPRPDGGDLIDQESVPILFEDTSLEVFRRVTDAAVRVVRRSYPLLAEGRAPRTPQDEARATTFGRRTPADGRLDWTSDALGLYHLVRAVTRPYPGAFGFLGDRKLFVWQAWPLPEAGQPSVPPGTCFEDPEGGLRVRCGSGALRLLEVQEEGAREDEAMPGLAPGARLS